MIEVIEEIGQVEELGGGKRSLVWGREVHGVLQESAGLVELVGADGRLQEWSDEGALFIGWQRGEVFGHGRQVGQDGTEGGGAEDFMGSVGVQEAGEGASDIGPGPGAQGDGELQLDPGMGVIGELQGCLEDGGGGAGLREAQGMGAESWMRIGESVEEDVTGELIQAVEGGPGMKAGQGLGMAGEGMEEGQGSGIAVLQEKLLGLVADPAVGRSQLGDPFGGG